MTSVKTKKKFIYFIFSCVFFLGGIEYAVILPTLWLYLHNTYNAPGYMLGLVLSAYSIASFFSSPIIGRVADKTRRTKEIFIFCACFQVIGSFLYFVGISEWLCVASRFICGLGGGGESVALAEVSRHTSEQERTGIISRLIAMRQIALLAAPGLNLGLRLLNYKIGPFDLNKYTVPGALMTILWCLLIVIIMTLYSEPYFVYNEEKKIKKEGIDEETIYSSNEISDNLYEPGLSIPVKGYVNGAVSTGDEIQQHYLKIHQCNEQSNHILPTVNNLNESYEVMATAERFICSSELNRQQVEVMDHIPVVDVDPVDSWSLTDASDAPPLLKTVDGRTDSNDIQNSANDDYIEHHTSHIDDIIAKEGNLGFFCNEYVRDDVIAILTLLFSAFFSQIALEAMCTPISLEYFDFGEIENSILYCLCGVEVVVSFIIVSVLSKRVSDRNMMMFGATLLLAANVCLIVFLPKAPKHDRSQNLPKMSVAIALDVFSFPFIFVCSTSLYSKMTRRETQGLSQGLRRAVAGLGTIIAPLWASSVLSRPYLVLGVLIGFQSLAFLMCLMSYKGLKGLQPPSNNPSSKTSEHSASRNSHTSSSATIIDKDDLTGTHSTQYGSISSTNSLIYKYSSLKTAET